MRFTVLYEHETRSYLALPAAVNENVRAAFSYMTAAYGVRPASLSGAQTVTGDISKIGGGTRDPVAVSARGQHDSAYGNFIYNARNCLSTYSCASRIDSALAELVEAEKRLTGVGLSLFGAGGNINWENTPPNYDVWLCNANRDCALVRYDKDSGWKYVESRAEGGRGKRYPKYGEELNYVFSNSGEASLFERGLRGARVDVLGQFVSSTRTVLACTTVSGVQRCEWRRVPF